MANPMSESKAVARAHAAGLEPLEPYPGRGGDKWRLRCQTCGKEHHKVAKVIEPCQHRLPAISNAEQRVRSLGYEPLEPHSGRATDPWLMKCTICGRTYRRRPQVKLAACRHTG